MKNIEKLSNYFYLLASNGKDLYVDFLDTVDDIKLEIDKVKEKELMYKFTSDEYKNDLKSCIDDLRIQIINKEKSNIKPIHLVNLNKKIKKLFNDVFKHSDELSFNSEIFDNFKSKIDIMINDYVLNYVKKNKP
jgi:hypothetical protein